MTEAMKFDGEKPKMGLLPSKALVEEAKVLTFGARKYEAHNWRKGLEFSRLYDAAQRHLVAWNDGEDLDPESGLSHIAHARCCLGFLLEFIVEGREGLDDRHLPERATDLDAPLGPPRRL